VTRLAYLKDRLGALLTALEHAGDHRLEVYAKIGTVVGEIDELEGRPRTRPPRRLRKATLTRALREAVNAGRPVKRAELHRDHVVLEFGELELEPAADVNEWDKALRGDTD
jgi:hypothetical protein